MSVSLAITSPGAIPDLGSLKAWIADEVDRDLTDITDKLDKWIEMAEARFNRELRSPEMERTVTGSASAEDTSLPDDFQAMRSIYIEGSPDLPLRGMSPAALKQEFDGTAGTPVAYALVGGGIRLAPPPSSPVLLTMDYFGALEPLSIYAPSNWLLLKHPDAYVTGVLFQYYRWSKDREAAIDANTLCTAIVDRVNRTARNNRYGAGPLVPNVVRQVWAAKA